MQTIGRRKEYGKIIHVTVSFLLHEKILKCRIRISENKINLLKILGVKKYDKLLPKVRLECSL